MELISSVRFGHHVDTAAMRAPSAMRACEITVDTAGQRHQAVFTEVTMPAEVRTLVCWPDVVAGREERIG